MFIFKIPSLVFTTFSSLMDDNNDDDDDDDADAYLCLSVVSSILSIFCEFEFFEFQ